MKTMRHSPTLIVIGGFPGAGKTTISRRLSSELSIPRLGSDTLGRTIRRSEWFQGSSTNAYRIGYDVLWRLCEEFLLSGVSVIVDANMGWPIAWQSVDSVRERCPGVVFLPIILRCPREICIERTRARHVENPAYYGPPEQFMTEEETKLSEFLDQLNRPDLHFVDASRSPDEVFQDIRQHVTE